MQPTQFINIVSTVPLVAPKVLKSELAITPATTKTVLNNREAIQSILAGEDRHVLVVVGPCSIHDPKAAVEYAARREYFTQGDRRFHARDPLRPFPHAA